MRKLSVPRPFGHLASPYGLAAASYLLFLAALVFPPRTYSSFMHEPNFVFFDAQTLAFYTLCVAFFLCGVALVDRSPAPDCSVDVARVPRWSPLVFLAAPVCIGIAFCLLSITLLLRSYPGLLTVLASQTGSVIKDSDTGLQTPLGLANTWLLGIVWWAGWRYRQYSMLPWQRRIVRSLVWLATLICALSAGLKLSRGELMPIFCGAGFYTCSGGAPRAGLPPVFVSPSLPFRFWLSSPFFS